MRARRARLPLARPAPATDPGARGERRGVLRRRGGARPFGAPVRAGRRTGHATRLRYTRDGRLVGNDRWRHVRPFAGRELDEQRVPGAQPRRPRLDAGLRVRCADVADLVVGHQRDHRARCAGPGGPAGPVQVGLVLDRRVGVDRPARCRRRGFRGPRCRWPPASPRCRRRTRAGCGCGRSAPGFRAAPPPARRGRPAAGSAPVPRRLVRVNTSVRPGAAARSTSTGSRSSSRMCSTWWDISATGVWAESTLCRTGLVRYRRTSTSTAAVQRRREQHALAGGAGCGPSAAGPPAGSRGRPCGRPRRAR